MAQLNPAAMALITCFGMIVCAWIIAWWLEACWAYENYKSYPERKRRLGREPLVRYYYREKRRDQ